MSEEYTDPAGESELRRRAAWFLGMLVVVAALLVTFMVLFLRSGNSKPPPTGSKPLPTAPPSTTQRHNPTPSTSARPTRRSRTVSVPPRVVNRHVSCPSEAPCIVHGDIGNAVTAINHYRVQHGAPAVSGAVTPAAQTCAVTNGDQCTGSWAETQVPGPSGREAVQKVLSLTNLLDPNLSSLEVGWAYNPAAREYYFAVIRDDS